MMKTFLLIVLLAVAEPAHSRASEEPIFLSLVQLIATPEKFDGKYVRVIGYLHLEFEGNAPFLHGEDHAVSDTKNGIWFDGTLDTMKRPNDFNDQYVLVEGTFDAKDQGHWALYSGALHDIKRVQSWAKFLSHKEPQWTK